MATLVALPVLFLGRGSVSIDASNGVSAVGVVATADDPTTTASDTASDATARSLLDTVDRKTLLDGGADPDASLQLQRERGAESSTTIVISPQATPTDPSPSALAGSPALAADQAAASTTPEPTGAASSIESSSIDAPATAAPTPAAPATAAPTTAAPATAAPTTAAPTTAAPTTAAPTTAATPSTAAPATAAPTTAAPAPAETGDPASTPADHSAAATPATSPSGAPSAEDWAALRACESFGSYTIVSGNGLYHGAYQFSVATWNATAAAAGRTDLIGVLPSEASPADQDALALNLWSRRGFAPWPHCGRGLG